MKSIKSLSHNNKVTNGPSTAYGYMLHVASKLEKHLVSELTMSLTWIPAHELVLNLSCDDFVQSQCLFVNSPLLCDKQSCGITARVDIKILIANSKIKKIQEYWVWGLLHIYDYCVPFLPKVPLNTQCGSPCDLVTLSTPEEAPPTRTMCRL